MGIYDELENLNKPSPPKSAPVASLNPPRRADKGQRVSMPSSASTESKQEPIKVKNSREKPRELSRDRSSDTSRDSLRDLPTRDEIQQFSFQLRDELKVKVQSEVPFKWQDELEELARQLDVKKLELYRYILGEFLGKVKRKSKS